MPNWYIRHSVDFERTPADRDNYTAPLVLMLPGDNQAHVWVVSAYADGQPVDLTGQTVQAFFTRSDGNTVAVTGTATGNAARVTLPRDAYLCRGELRAVMRLGDSVSVVTDPVTTLKEVTFYVKNGFGNIVDPQTSFPTVAGLAEDLAADEGLIAANASAITAIQNALASRSWTEMTLNTPTVAAGSSAYYLPGIFYRQEIGGHMVLRANVALQYSGSQITLTSAALPSDLLPGGGKVLHALGAVSTGEKFALGRFMISGDGYVKLEKVQDAASGSTTSSHQVDWTSVQFDWYL